MELANWAELIGAVVSAVALIVIGVQVRDSRKIAKGQFLLNLDAEFREHDEIYYVMLEKVRIIDDRIKINKLIRYLGLFERIDSLVRDGILTIRQVNSLYGYRLDDVLANDAIYGMICEYNHKWGDLIHLLREIDDYRESAGLLSSDKEYQASSERIGRLPHPEPDWRASAD